MSGTDLAYGGADRGSGITWVWYASPSAYARARRCPALTNVWQYAKFGSEIAYGGMRSPVLT
eukprot:2349523-Rhodomonas_salina.2